MKSTIISQILTQMSLSWYSMNSKVIGDHGPNIIIVETETNDFKVMARTIWTSNISKTKTNDSNYIYIPILSHHSRKKSQLDTTTLKLHSISSHLLIYLQVLLDHRFQTFHTHKTKKNSKSKYLIHNTIYSDPLHVYTSFRICHATSPDAHIYQILRISYPPKLNTLMLHIPTSTPHCTNTHKNAIFVLKIKKHWSSVSEHPFLL